MCHGNCVVLNVLMITTGIQNRDIKPFQRKAVDILIYSFVIASYVQQERNINHYTKPFF